MKVRNPDKLIEALKGINEFMDDNGVNVTGWVMDKSAKVRLAAVYYQQLRENVDRLKTIIASVKNATDKTGKK